MSELLGVGHAGLQADAPAEFSRTDAVAYCGRAIVALSDRHGRWRRALVTVGVTAFLTVAAGGWALTFVADLRLLDGGWPGALAAPGDIPASRVLWAIAHSSSIAAAYRRDPMDPYPLPYDLALAPLALIDGYIARAVTTAVCIVLVVAALRPFVRNRWALVPLAGSAPVAHLVTSPHPMAAISLGGIALAAVAAERQRWWWCGLGVCVAMIRPPNALPVAAAALIAAARSDAGLRRFGSGFCIPMCVIAAPAFAVDPAWPRDFIGNLQGTMYAGLPLLAAQVAGSPGVAALAVAPAVITGIISTSRPTAAPATDAALGAALGVVGSKLSGLYSGIFVLPALAATGARPGLAAAPWVVSAATWATVLTASPDVLRGQGLPAELAGLVYLLAVACFPIAVPLGRSSVEAHDASDSKTP